ncbi:MAG: RHS repeat protein, partial [Caulobacteraceae bacterium]|nr:RHS repeat protein [Caulobacteraceae bacterium]
SYLYDTDLRTIRETHPEGDYVEYGYDGRGNLTSTTAVAKPGSGLANIVTSTTYPASCSSPYTAANCNQPLTTTDARGNVTDYVWNGTHGGLESVTAPLPDASATVRPQTRISYAAQTAYYKNSSGVITAAPSSIALPVSTSACANNAAPGCVGTIDEVRSMIAYGSSGVANNLLPTSMTRGDGGGTISVTTTSTYDPNGDVQTVDGPLAGTGDTTRYRYDAARQLVGIVGPDPDAGGGLLNRAQRITYNGRGQAILTEAGMTPGYSDTDWSSFVTLQRQATEYDSWGRPVVARSQDAAGNTLALQQVGYDAAGRTQCTATRMNPGAFYGLPGATNACSQTAAGWYGPDRIVQTVYDAASRPVSSTSGVGTASTITESVSYTANGRPASLTDGAGNISTYAYDGFDRVYRQCYPGAATCASATPSVYEQYGYDAGSNLISYRDRSGQTFGQTFDNLNRLTSNSSSATPTKGYAYDNLNRPRYAWTPAGAMWAVYWGWDALNRKLYEQVADTSAAVTTTVSYGWDEAGRLDRMGWPDGFYVDYDWSYGNDLVAIRENGNPSWALQTTAYDNLGRPIATGKGNGVVSSWSYDGIGRLASLSQDVAGTAQDLTLGFTYNPAGQIVSRSVSNSAYVYTPASTAIAYVNNILNQLTSINGSGVGYNSRGDITSAPGATYGYDGLGQMTSSSTSAGSAAYAYDSTGRLYRSTGSTTRRYLYDGQQVIAEYDGSGVIQGRYVPGLGLNDVVTSYDAGGNRSWWLSDER